MGRIELWDRATSALGDALDKAGLAYRVAEGEGAFYGPKIDLHVRDAIGRRWQVTTLQVDFGQPDNFHLEYASTGNTGERPVMIHRALFGSVERFLGVLLEHYAGALPGWLAPVQATIVPVADRHHDYAAAVAAALGAAGLRAEVDVADDTVGREDPPRPHPEAPRGAGRGGSRCGRRHGGAAPARRRRGAGRDRWKT